MKINLYTPLETEETRAYIHYGEEKNMDVNKLKHEVLDEMADTEVTLRSQVELLEALDQYAHHSGCYNLHDQLNTFRSLVTNLQSVIARSKLIVPTEGK